MGHSTSILPLLTKYIAQNYYIVQKGVFPMDKLIIFGRVYSFISSKTGKEFYKIEYLDENGVSNSDFISASAFNQINSRGIKTGECVTANFQLNQYNRGEIVDCTFD